MNEGIQAMTDYDNAEQAQRDGEMEIVPFDKTKTHTVYKNSAGKRLPGVTTALNIINKPALLHWAWKLGTEGKDYKKVRDQAADIGTIAHFMCECHVKGKQPDMSTFSPTDISKAENAFLKFLEFWKGYTLIGSEIRDVSEVYQYGGTLDIMARNITGELCLIDLKTSKAIYPEMWMQVAAYGEIWHEHHADDRIGKYMICRIGKEEQDGDFEVRERKSLKVELDTFKTALSLYNKLKKVK